MGVRVGFEGRLYRNTGTYASPSWDEVAAAQDISFSDSMSENEASRRARNGLKERLAGMRDFSAEFSVLRDSADPDYIALKAAYESRALIDMVFLDDPITVSGQVGIRINGQLFSQGFEAAMDGPVVAKFKLAPSVKSLITDESLTTYTVP